MWLIAACRRRVRIYYSQSPFAVCFAFVRFLLTLPTLGPAKESTAFHPLQRGPSTRKARGEACVEGMSLSIRKTRPPADLRGRVTPARETQDSRKYGFDTIFSQSKLDLGRQKLSYSQYDSCGNTPGNWVSTIRKHGIRGCKKPLEKAKLHRRILVKGARKRAANWVSTTL